MMEIDVPLWNGLTLIYPCIYFTKFGLIFQDFLAVKRDRLLKEYFPERNQTGLFKSGFDDDELIREAYRKKNAEIGYRIKDELLV